MPASPVRIAMWSGPRNISTAFMRAWENRPDCHVVDEPFYAHYLAETGLDHPMREAVIASQPIDPKTVIAALTGPVPGDRPIFYQKQMAHHLLPSVPRGWIDTVVNVFLIRDPRAMLASYLAKRDAATLEDLGLPQQVSLFDQVRQTSSQIPIVLDAADVLRNPEGMLRTLCDRLDIPFVDTMLTWPAGRRDSDGIWAEHWYAAVEASTGFQPYVEKPVTLPASYNSVAETAAPLYRHLWNHRLKTA